MNLKNNQSLTNNIQVSTQTFELSQLFDLKEKWLILEENAHATFFLSWRWIGSWLTQPMPQQTIFLVKATQNNIIVGLAIFVEKIITRHKLITARQWYLHRCGNEKTDQIWIENNDFLLNSSNKDAIRDAMWAHLLQFNHNVDEFIINVANKHRLNAISIPTTYTKIIENNELGYAVNCKDNRNFNEYFDTLSKNTKQQWKRSAKALEQLGNVEFNVETDKNQQLDILLKTSHWHINKWKNSNTPSGFLNEYFIKFHKELINGEHLDTKTLVTTLTINNEITGCLYCFQKNCEFYFYLSNLKPLENNKIKLGIALHMFMIEWIYKAYPQNGRYDFLAGEARYKKSLSSNIDEYAQITLQKNKLLYKLERIVKNLR